jgi:hypothetical protein
MELTKPSDDKIRELQGLKFKSPESQKKQELLMQKLKEAAYGDPVYLKKNIDTEQSQNQPSKREIN